MRGRGHRGQVLPFATVSPLQVENDPDPNIIPGRYLTYICSWLGEEILSNYRDVIIQTYSAVGERSPRKIRARPIASQGLDVEMKVECSEAMRNRYPPGSYLLIQAKVTDRKGSPPFLYSYYGDSYQKLKKAEVDQILKRRY